MKPALVAFNRYRVKSIVLSRPDGPTLSFSNASIVLAGEVIDGHLSVVDGMIAAVDDGAAPSVGADLEGDFLLPGLIDIHTDHYEKHVFPRPHVRWDYRPAALAHDAQIIGAGITTVFDSLCVGATLDAPERKDILVPMIEALEFAQDAGMLRAEHFVHLRCEIIDEETPDIAAASIERDIVRIVSVMEHVPGVRQSKDIGAYIERYMARTGESDAQIRVKIEEIVARCASIGECVRPQIVDLAHKFALPLLSHDDTDPEHVDLAVSEGVRVSEFPCTLAAARGARAAAMAIVAGAPNLLRGGSQSGNVAVSDLIAEGLVDVLASDYVPRSLIDSAFGLAADPTVEFDLPSAVRLATKAPAELAGLGDRGEIAVGKRADLLRVALQDGNPVAKGAWRGGIRVW